MTEAPIRESTAASGHFVVHVREAEGPDIDAACAVMHAAFMQYGAGGRPSGAMLETPDSLRTEVAAGDVRVAVGRRDDEPVAMVKFRRAGDGSLYFSRLAVLPGHRGTGVTRALLDWLSGLARREGATGLSCCVRAEETDLIAMYEHLGLRVTGHSDKPSLTGRVIPVTWLSDIHDAAGRTTPAE